MRLPSRSALHFGLLAVGLAAIALLVVGCDARSAPASIFISESPEARAIRDLGVLLGIVALVVVAGVEIVLFVAILRGLHKPADSVKQVHGNARLEIAWTVITAVVFFIIFGLTVKTMIDVTADPAGASPLQSAFPNDTVVMRSTGWRWWWAFEYPALGVVTANEVYVPTDKPTLVELRSGDVIHSWWVPRLSGKMDMVPGRTNYVTFVATAPGAYQGFCAEFCGSEHARMGFRVVAVSVQEFSAWAKAQKASAAEPQTDAEKAGQRAFAGTCAACHTIRGTAAAGKIGPDLTHFGSRTSLAAETLPNTPENVSKWLTDPQRVKPANLMPNQNLSAEVIQQLVAYLSILK